MRSLSFRILFTVFTTVFALCLVLLSFLPGRKPLMLGLSAYTKSIVWLMRVITGIKLTVTGKEHIPAGPAIIASKHQSYGDGIVLFSQIHDLTFVADNHLQKFASIKRILSKAGAVIIDNCGGTDVRDQLQIEAQKVRDEGRKILIYPEGHLSLIGTQHRYRKGVFFLYKDFDCPVVPVATNLGQRWNQTDHKKHPGPAALEFLEPIMPGLEKDEFMRELESRIETRSREMLDLENLGALDPANIGLLLENEAALRKRLAKEAAEAQLGDAE